MDPIYEPREDSFLLAKNVKKYAFGSALDMGTGAGFLAKAAAEVCDDVLAVDINPECIKYCNENSTD